jgi:hypothetical protein
VFRAILLSFVCALGLGAQTASFSPQYSLGNLTLWEVDVSGAKANLPTASIWAVAAAHKIGHVDASLVANLITKATGTTVWGMLQKGCTVAASGAAVGAYIKAQPSFANDPVATRIALGAVTLAGLCGVVAPTLTAQNATSAPPTVQLLATEMTVGSNGAGSGWFWSLQGGTAFTDKLQ